MVGVVLFLTCDDIHNLFLKEVFIVLSPHDSCVINEFDSNLDSRVLLCIGYCIKLSINLCLQYQANSHLSELLSTSYLSELLSIINYLSITIHSSFAISYVFIVI